MSSDLDQPVCTDARLIASDSPMALRFRLMINHAKRPMHTSPAAPAPAAIPALAPIGRPVSGLGVEVAVEVAAGVAAVSLTLSFSFWSLFSSSLFCSLPSPWSGLAKTVLTGVAVQVTWLSMGLLLGSRATRS